MPLGDTFFEKKTFKEVTSEFRLGNNFIVFAENEEDTKHLNAIYAINTNATQRDSNYIYFDVLNSAGNNVGQDIHDYLSSFGATKEKKFNPNAKTTPYKVSFSNVNVKLWVKLSWKPNDPPTFLLTRKQTNAKMTNAAFGNAKNAKANAVNANAALGNAKNAKVNANATLGNAKNANAITSHPGRRGQQEVYVAINGTKGGRLGKESKKKSVSKPPRKRTSTKNSKTTSK
jgi:hypothetical protein